MKKYDHIFFDLDRTLWDFERNSNETLKEAFLSFKLSERGVSDFDTFMNQYMFINEEMWKLYREEKISKVELRSTRFGKTLEVFGVYDGNLAEEIGEYYIAESPRKTNLFPYTHDVLQYLIEKEYQLHIITNGFEEVQHVKIENGRLKEYFKNVVTSEKAGVKKPHQDIFHYSLQQANAVPEKSLMIGDDLPVDVIGARNIGMDQVYFNPEELSHNEDVTYEVSSLIELKSIL